MNDLKFAQTSNRNIIVPVLIAFMLLGAAIALVVRQTPRQTVDLTISHVVVYPTHTVFKSDSIKVGSDRTEDNLFVLLTLKIDNPQHLPIFLKDFTATLNSFDDGIMTVRAADAKDLSNIYTSFPGLKPLASAPLRREVLISPGTAVEGMVLLSFPITEDVWNHRRSAVLDVSFYHEGKFSVSIPFNSNGVSTNFEQ
ncbi:MAG TPA: hypothetical protein VFE38_14385 [Edaphobacter sp.]|nr:hypothetical protein [Edaphobacter sp.]